MKTFKEFSINIAPKGHKIVKVINHGGHEMMVTKKDNQHHVMHDNEIVHSTGTEREAIRHARDFGKKMSKGKLGKTGATASNLGSKRTTSGYFK